MKKKTAVMKQVALYERLSVDESSTQESDSIVSQKEYLVNYCLRNGYTNYQHYTDDGISGADFSRPGWNQMMEDIEAGKISVVITKDMSRIGRDYLQVGLFTDVFLPAHGVRFIAVLDSIDSTRQDSTEFAPILNLMSEWYLRDISEKLKAAFRSKGNSGKHLTVNPPYGYIKDAKDKTHWVIDEAAAVVVRRIFQMIIDGKGYRQIARILTDEKIPTPIYHKHLTGQKAKVPKHPYAWRDTMVRNIVCRIEYAGWTVNFKSRNISYKTHKKLTVPEEERKLFANTQEPIVSMETWELAQKRRVRKSANEFETPRHPLEGKVFCADCGAKMYHRKTYGRAVLDEEGNETGRRVAVQDFYCCSTYMLSQYRHEKACEIHFVRTNAINTVVLETLKAVTNAALTDEKAFLSRIQAMPDKAERAEQREREKRLFEKKQRCTELDRLIQNLYEANVAKRITDKRFVLLSGQYEAEQEQLEQEITVLEEQIDSYAEAGQDAKQFLSLVRKRLAFTELTQEIADLFIEKVIVHKVSNRYGEREQEIEVCLNYIGKVPNLSRKEEAV